MNNYIIRDHKTKINNLLGFPKTHTCIHCLLLLYDKNTSIHIYYILALKFTQLLIAFFIFTDG